jgi:iron complex transport system permease protein
MSIKNRYLLLSALFLTTLILGISVGVKNINFLHFFSLSELDKTILLRIRIPRILATFIVGAGLSVTGSVLQATLKNPLAESYTLGISGGASLGICVGIIMGKVLVIPFFAFIGALASVSIILTASIKKRLSNTSIILLGVALNFLFSSFVLFLLAVVKNDKFQSTMLWLIGDFSSFPTKILPLSFIIILCLSLYFVFSGKIYDILSLGDEKATSLGINVEKEKRTSFFLSCIIVGLCVSLSGLIGFVGLVSPHISRYFFGTPHKKNLPATFLIGATFLMSADTIARTLIKPIEVPVGVITGFFGGLFFLFMLLHRRERGI